MSDNPLATAGSADEPAPSTDSGIFYRQPVEWRLDLILGKIANRLSDQVTIAYFDIDRYGQVEEEHGWGIADALLKAVEAELTHAEQATFSGRYVRDGFMVLYENVGLEDAFLIAERLRHQLSTTVFKLDSGIEKAKVSVTFSAGIAGYPGESQTRHEIVALAEEAARRALENGGNRSALARPVNMVPKTSHYLPPQLERLRELAHQQGRAEAELLREALDDLLRKYDQRVARRGLVGLLNKGATGELVSKGGGNKGNNAS